MQDAEKYSVLVVDDESSNIMTLSHILSPLYTVYAAKSGKNAIKAAHKYLPDLIMLDVIMPEMDGYDVITELKSSEKTKNIPVVFITGLSGPGEEEKGLSLGAADYITKPFSSEVVRLRIRNQITVLEQMRAIERIGMLDGLTGLPNRRSFDQRFNLEWKRARREKTPISILTIDVDRFKNYNDAHGHVQGDVALQVIAKIIEGNSKRPGDFAARWGGEEFIVLMSDTDEDGAFNVAEQIRGDIEKAKVPCNGGRAEKVTVSIGCNTRYYEQGERLTEFISGADKALYRAKETGRNRVCASGK